MGRKGRKGRKGGKREGQDGRDRRKQTSGGAASLRQPVPGRRIRVFGWSRGRDRVRRDRGCQRARRLDGRLSRRPDRQIGRADAAPGVVGVPRGGLGRDRAARRGSHGASSVGHCAARQPRDGPASGRHLAGALSGCRAGAAGGACPRRRDRPRVAGRLCGGVRFVRSRPANIRGGVCLQSPRGDDFVGDASDADRANRGAPAAGRDAGAGAAGRGRDDGERRRAPNRLRRRWMSPRCRSSISIRGCFDRETTSPRRTAEQMCLRVRDSALRRDRWRHDT